MKNDSVENFYDELSPDYHLIFDDWDKAMKRQAKIIDSLITKYSKIKPVTLLDCSCGIGTQAIGLAQKGYKIHATDLSPKAIKRAKSEAKKRAVFISFDVVDFRNLENQVEGQFDVVISCDNSLPHLLTDEDLLSAAKNIFSKMKPSGLFLASIRDYDQLLTKKPISTPANVKTYKGEKTISFQVWDWKSDTNVYTVNHFTLKGSQDMYETHVRKTRYRAYKRDEISDVFDAAGFFNIKWLMPNESGYYQPILIAYKSKVS